MCWKRYNDDTMEVFEMATKRACIDYIKIKLLEYEGTKANDPKEHPAALNAIYDDCKTFCGDAGMIGDTFTALWDKAITELHSNPPAPMYAKA